MPTKPDSWQAVGPWLAERIGELGTSIAFLTRLPLSRATPVTGAALAPAVWAFPIAGVVVGLIGAVVYALAHRVGLPPWPAAALTVAPKSPFIVALAGIVRRYASVSNGESQAGAR